MSLAKLAELVEGRFASLGSRLTELEQRDATARSSGAGAPIPANASRAPGLLGGPLSSGDPYAQARELLGRGAPPRFLVGAGQSQARSPGVRASLMSQESPVQEGYDVLLARLVQLLEGKRSQPVASLGEALGLGGEPLGAGDLDPAMLALGQGEGNLSRQLGGRMQLERLLATRRNSPALFSAATMRRLETSLRVLPGESWSYQRHATSEVLPSVGNYHTLARVITMVAACLDEG